MTLKKGDRFIHPTKLDLNWLPSPGQTYVKDCPKATCVVTSTRGDTIYYRYATSVYDGAFKTTQQALANLIEAYKS